jgi:hypothetical protein
MIQVINNVYIFVETIKNKTMKAQLSKSVEERAIKLIIEGIEVLEAIKLAIIEEQNLIEEMIAQKTERSKQAKNQICKNIYGLIHLTY